VPASFVVTADHNPGRDDGGPLGQRFCWSGSEVVGNDPKLTQRTPMHRNITTVDGGASGVEGLAGQTSNQARCIVSSTGLLWRQGVVGFAVPGINKWSVINTSAGGRTQWHSAQLFRQLLILPAPVVLTTDK
jgi:hypothetical protein